MSDVSVYTLYRFPERSYPRLTHVGFSSNNFRLDSGIHWHPAYEFVYFFTGGLSVSVHERESAVTMEADDLLVMSPYSIHTFATAQGPLDCYWLGIQTDSLVFPGPEEVMFSPAIGRGYLRERSFSDFGEDYRSLRHAAERLRVKDTLLIRRVPEAGSIIEDIYRESRNTRVFARDFIHVKVLELFLTILRRLEGEKEDFDVVSFICDYIHCHYREKITLQKLAEVTGFSSAYICTRFKHVRDTTIMRYLTEYRLGKAKGLLLSGSSVTRAAQECGFADIHHFSRVFKNITGNTPSGYVSHP
jgi:AraC-like DNA-binding protein